MGAYSQLDAEKRYGSNSIGAENEISAFEDDSDIPAFEDEVEPSALSDGNSAASATTELELLPQILPLPQDVIQTPTPSAPARNDEEKACQRQ